MTLREELNPVDLEKVFNAITDALDPLTMEEKVRVMAASACLSDFSLARRTLAAFLNDAEDEHLDREEEP